MEIKAVKFRKDGFYSQLFAFGGEEGPEKYSMDIRYRGSLQNYLIDTGDEVILVDTGLPEAGGNSRGEARSDGRRLYGQGYLQLHGGVPQSRLQARAGDEDLIDASAYRPFGRIKVLPKREDLCQRRGAGRG